MAGKATFDGFDPYKLTGVRVTDQKLGHGSYATVLELEYMGLKCAGKKIHELLLEQEDASYTVHRFEEECRILSQVRHPNFVQFLGVHFQERVQAPILVMEFLPTNLTSCIEQYGILPKEISYSVLHDVALGLCYLHSQAPPIIHRDLSSNNILLTPNMIAKISDLGVARILNLTPLQVSGMTQTPGTPAYMPPEVMVANPNYNTSVDEFSYGIMMIHMFSGRWPEPQVGQTRIEGGKLIPVTEAERREVFLNAIEENHPLMDLIHKCIDNNPQLRPHAGEIIRRVSQIASQFPASFANRLELLRRIERDGREKRALTEAGERKDGIILQNEKQILSLKNEVRQKAIEMERLRFSHSTEVEQLQLQLRDMKTQNQYTKAEIEAEIAELNSKSKILFEEREQSTRLLREEQEQHTIVGIQLRNEREANRKLLIDVQNLQSEVTTLHGIVSRKEATIKRKDTELEAKSRALGEKDATISTMSERITKAREYLATTKLQTCITWKQCADLPISVNLIKNVVINGNVYCGGGMTHDDDTHIVYCYDPSQDKWTTLPPLPVERFGLGQVNGKLVAVGGVKKDNKKTNDVYAYDERSQKWKQTISPMPTARDSPGVLSLHGQSTLIVAGGNTPSQYAVTVEIFKPDTSQWYTTDPLPKACRDLSLVAIGNTCYALGGYSFSALKQALYASVDDLLGNAVPASQTTHSDSSGAQLAWKTLPSNAPTYGPAAAVLAGNLLAIGGSDNISDGGAIKKAIYMYSPSTISWIYISDLPAPRSGTTVTVLPSSEVLVIGGTGDDGGRVNTVYKGTLSLL